jgi:hypothetical protein
LFHALVFVSLVCVHALERDIPMPNAAQTGFVRPTTDQRQHDDMA